MSAPARWLGYLYPGCRRNKHDWQYVGDKWERLNESTAVGWNYECSRCGKHSSRANPSRGGGAK